MEVPVAVRAIRVYNSATDEWESVGVELPEGSTAPDDADKIIATQVFG